MEAFRVEFRNSFGFHHDTVEEWLDQAANSPVELGEEQSRIAERRTKRCT